MNVFLSVLSFYYLRIQSGNGSDYLSVLNDQDKMRLTKVYTFITIISLSLLKLYFCDQRFSFFLEKSRKNEQTNNDSSWRNPL